MERDDEQRFLQELAAYMAPHELLPPAVTCSISEHDLKLLLDDDAPPARALLTPQEQQQQHPDDDDAMSSASYSYSGCGSESSSQQRAAPPKRKSTYRRPKRSRNPSRERLQSELKQLRALSVELEQRLVALQRREKKKELKPEERSLLTAWGRIAKRQLEERSRAESENAQLKRKVHTQLAFAVSVQQAARHLSNFGCEVNSRKLDGLFQLSSQIQRRACIEPENVATFETLFNEVDVALLRMDSVFQQNGLSNWRVTNANPQAPLLAPMKSRRLSELVDGSLSVELLNTDVHLFDKESVWSALWRCWEQLYVTKNYFVYESALQARDAIAGRMNVDVVVDGESIPVDTRFVLKLQLESDCIRYVWRAMSDVNSLFPRVRINETGWEELHSIQTQDQSGNSMEGTVILSCSQMESKPPSPTTSAAGKSEVDAVDIVAPLANMMISSYEAELVEVNCLMMDLLLKETGAMPSPAV